MGVTSAILASTKSPTDQLMQPINIAVLVIIAGIFVFCAYQCAKNRRWGWFIAGFLCTPFAWVIGALLPRPRSSYRRY